MNVQLSQDANQEIKVILSETSRNNPMKNLKFYQNIPFFHSENCPNAKMKTLSNQITFPECFDKLNGVAEVNLSALILDSQNNVLLLKNKNIIKQDDSLNNCWLLPGDTWTKHETAMEDGILNILKKIGFKGDQLQNAQKDLILQNIYEKVSPHDINLGFPQKNEISFNFFFKLNHSYKNEKNFKIGFQGNYLQQYEGYTWVHIDKLINSCFSDKLPRDENIQMQIISNEDTNSNKLCQTFRTESQSIQLLRGRYRNLFGEGISEQAEIAIRLQHTILG